MTIWSKLNPRGTEMSNQAFVKTVVITNDWLDSCEELSVTVDKYEDQFDVEFSRDGDSITIPLDQLRDALAHVEVMVKQYDEDEAAESGSEE